MRHVRWISSRSGSNEVRSASDYCAQLLKKYDAPSYTLLAFIPPVSRSAYLAIRAFNIEIARIPETVSAPHVGAIRYQFWRDNLAKALEGMPAKHPVSLLISSAAESLDARSHGRNKFSKSWFMRIIAAREQYMNSNPYPSLSALETYAEHTYSTLLYLTLQSIPMASVAADHVASHIGKASGIVAVLRGLPLLAFPPPSNHHANNMGLDPGISQQRDRSRQGVVNLPLDVMAEAGVKEEEVFRLGAEAPGLKDAVFATAIRASDHLITARTMISNLRRGEDVGHEFEHGQEKEHSNNKPNEALSQQLSDIEKAFGIFMPAVSTSMWLENLQAYDFDVFRNELRQRSFWLPWKAYRANRSKQF